MIKTSRKGFNMTFDNGWTVSVQTGTFAYANNKNDGDAEIAAWDSNNNWFVFKNGDDVLGYQDADAVAAFIAMIAGLKS